MTRRELSCLARNILQWYAVNKRPLPWRDDPHPYKIWVSEIMLQQTRVEAVLPLFHRFIAAFPTVQHLAAASEDDVLSVWQGLGYYSRARRLHQAAGVVVDDHGGELPADLSELLSLPGIGPYTAAAIASIAFGIKAVALDGNLLRVGARLFAIADDIASSKTRRRIEEAFLEHLPAKNAGDFNQALMDLGSAICIPGSPRCPQCPAAICCQANKQGRTAELPCKSAKKPPLPQAIRVFFIETAEHILLRQRNHGNFLQGMWEVPWVPMQGDPTRSSVAATAESALPPEAAALQQSLSLGLPKEIRTAEYVFSHRHWYMTIYCYTVNTATVLPPAAPGTNYRWYPKAELQQAALPTVFQRVLPRSLRTRS